VGQQYSWVSSAFYFGYLVATYPASLCFVKLPLGKFLASSMYVNGLFQKTLVTLTLHRVVWAVILACHGAVTNFGSLSAIRVLLGIFESVISPGFSLLTGMWYKPSEHAWRHGIWFAGNSMANLFGGVLSYAIGHISDGIAPWRVSFQSCTPAFIILDALLTSFDSGCLSYLV
jgi:MFS transporter, ACS family, allantoate permease